MSLSEKINSESTGKKIRHYLLLNGKNASDLAEHFGITRQGMSYKLENDSWDFKEIQKVAEYLKVTIQDLT
uniref:Putative DNA binding, helix-turn-helix domain containing protein n=1 Tax=viral metagenome TaxID=1070528 RepID=A0A6M3LF36_9ZZZZ